MGMLSTNFSEEEIACRCCGICKVDMRLVNALQVLRDKLYCPIKINSSCRCEKHNEEVGGEEKSKHLFNMEYQPLTLAADITTSKFDLATLYGAILTIDDFKNGGIGIYPYENFIHVDVRQEDTPKRWAMKNHKYVDFNKVLTEIGYIGETQKTQEKLPELKALKACVFTLQPTQYYKEEWVYIVFNRPNPDESTNAKNLVIKLQVPLGTGAKYVKDNFGIMPLEGALA